MQLNCNSQTASTVDANDNFIMSKRKIYVVGNAGNYTNWMQGDIVDTMDKADLVLFTGGEDVDPSFYHEPKHPLTGSNKSRDIRESQAFMQAQQLGKHIIGICRGSQFVCVMSGGRLVQHQENNSFYHRMKTLGGPEIVVTSTHHQAQYPWALPPEDFLLIGWTTDQSSVHEDGFGDEMVNGHPLAQNREVEMALYRKTKALAIQSHPEMVYDRMTGVAGFHEYIQFCQDLLDMHMSDKL